MSEDHITLLSYIGAIGILAFGLFSAAGLLRIALRWLPPRRRNEAQATEHVEPVQAMCPEGPTDHPIYGGEHLHLENQAPPKNLRITEDTEDLLRLYDEIVEEMKADDN